jgi:hypothetical protein
MDNIIIDCEFCFIRTVIKVEDDQAIAKYCPICGETPEIETDEEELLFDS